MIRKLCPGDKDAYIRLAGEFYHSPAVLHPVPPENLEKTFEEMMRSDVYADCYVYTHQENVVAFLLISKTYSQEVGGLCVWIEEVYVEAAHRGKGIGTALLEHTFHDYPQAARFRLEIEPDNAAAEKLYTRLGFRPLNYRQMVRDRADEV